MLSTYRSRGQRMNNPVEIVSGTTTPDHHSRGFLDVDPDALRYDNPPDDADEAAALLRRLIPKHGKVLDIGCGTGSVTLAATRSTEAKVLGIEPDPQRAALAQSRGLDVICGVADRDLLQKHGPFDAVILADVLEHLPEPAELLRDLAPFLTPGGKILASIPNVAHWTVRYRLLIGKFDYQPVGIMDATHLRWFTHYTVRMLFDRCGYKILSMRPTAGAWMPEYRAGLMRLMSDRRRAALVGRLARAFPRLFACQFIVEAERKS
jgi:methionine biosynthesis protein MetW